jgi:hypothetical protein
MIKTGESLEYVLDMLMKGKKLVMNLNDRRPPASVSPVRRSFTEATKSSISNYSRVGPSASFHEPDVSSSSLKMR